MYDNEPDLDALLPDDWTPSTAAGEGGGDFEPLPAGWYTARITASEMAKSKAGTAWMVKLTLTVESEPHAGRLIWDNVIVSHQDSKKAVEVGRQRLGELCVAAGFSSKPKAREFLGKVVQVKVKVRKSAEYGDSNDVKSYRPAEGAMQPASFDDDEIPF